MIAELEKEIKILENQANSEPLTGGTIGCFAVFGVLPVIIGICLIRSFWGWILIGLGAFLTLGGIATVSTGRKNKANATELLPQKKAELEALKKHN